MNITDGAAWWGAIVASLVFLWDIYKWKTEGPKIRITASTGMQLLENDAVAKEKYIMVNISNVGSRKTTLTHLVGQHYKNKLNQLVNKAGYSFFIPKPAFDKPFPFQIDVGETWSGGIIQNEQIERMSKEGILVIGVHDSSKEKATKVRVKIREGS